MTDLISRKDAMDEVEIAVDGFWHHEVIRRAYEYLERNIKALPAVDAVPVVRCGKCAHTETDGCEVPAIYCKKWDRWEMPEDFFCAYGERKEDDI